MAQTKFKLRMQIILLSVFLDGLSFSLLLPITPSLVQHFTGTPANATFAIALLIASCSFAQFIAGPIIGVLSDRYGRRPIILLTLTIGVVVGADAVEGKQHPMPINAEKETQVLVGRLRQVRGGSNAFMAFVSGDQLLKGAAYNAVQIYDRLRHHIRGDEV